MPDRRHLFDPRQHRRAPVRRHRSHPVDMDVHLHWFNPGIGRVRQPPAARLHPIVELIVWLAGSLVLLPWRIGRALWRRRARGNGRR